MAIASCFTDATRKSLIMADIRPLLQGQLGDKFLPFLECAVVSVTSNLLIVSMDNGAAHLLNQFVGLWFNSLIDRSKSFV